MSTYWQAVSIYNQVPRGRSIRENTLPRVRAEPSFWALLAKYWHVFEILTSICENTYIFFNVDICWNIDINLSIYQFIDISIYRYIDLSIYRYIDLSIYRYFDISIYRHFDILIYRYIDLSKYRYIYILSINYLLIICIILYDIYIYII